MEGVVRMERVVDKMVVRMERVVETRQEGTAAASQSTEAHQSMRVAVRLRLRRLDTAERTRTTSS